MVEHRNRVETTAYNCGIEFTKLMLKFNAKEDEIVLYLSF